MRGHSQRNLPAIASEITTYFSKEITPNFTNDVKQKQTLHVESFFYKKQKGHLNSE